MKKLVLSIVVVFQLFSSSLVAANTKLTDPSSAVSVSGVSENDDFIVRKKKSGFEVSLKKELLPETKLVITSQNGEVVLQQKLGGNYSNFFVAMHGFAKGNYLVKLTSADTTSEMAFVWE